MTRTFICSDFLNFQEMFWKQRYLLFLLLAAAQTAVAQCNGSVGLCGKRFNEVAYVTTHNAFNAEEEGFSLPNHTYGITRQLNDGVRGLMIDVYDEGGIATVYHSLAFLGTTTLESNLIEIKNFLDANPNEVVTIIFECYADFVLVEEAFINANILDYTHEQETDDPWPTLQEMIDSGKRLVVLSDRDDAPSGEDWYHYVWAYAVETPFSNSSNSDFTCGFNRGNPENDLFILNHFATDPSLGVGRTDLSELANEFNFFYNRADECWNALGKFPNFLTIDFHELGDVFEVADSLNARLTVGITEATEELPITVMANPSKGAFHFSLPQPETGTVSVMDINGQIVATQSFSGQAFEVDLSDHAEGLYHAIVRTDRSASAVRLVLLN